MPQWTATSSGIVLASSPMKRIVVEAGKKCGSPFTVEKDGVLYKTYGPTKIIEPAVVTVRGIQMLRCPRCGKDTCPRPGSKKLPGHVKTGTKEMCR